MARCRRAPGTNQPRVIKAPRKDPFADQRLIFELVGQDGPFTGAEVAERADLSRSEADAALNALRNKGALQRVSLEDQPGHAWALSDKAQAWVAARAEQIEKAQAEESTDG